MTLEIQLIEAEAQVERLKRQIGSADCKEIGSCDWEVAGGRNAACDQYCGCSVLVHICRRCGDCDYGNSGEALKWVGECPERLARFANANT